MTSALRTAAPVDARARRRSHPRVMTPRSGARWLIVSLAALLVGCGDDVATTPANLAVDAGTDSGPARPRVRLLVDANRDGTVSDTGDDEAFRASWDAAHGAVFLANLDDDDDDDVLDSADDVVNGEADALDLARVRVAPMPDLVEGATGRLALTGPTRPAVRVFRVDGGAWQNLLTDVTSSSLTLANRPGGHNYRVRVRASDQRGNLSPWSSELRVWVP